MDELKNEIQLNLKQIKKMESFIALSLRRDNIGVQFTALVANIENVRKLMLSSYQELNDGLEALELEHEQLLRRMRQQQIVILEYLLNQKKTKIEKESGNAHNSLNARPDVEGAKNPVYSSARKGLPEKLLKINLNSGYRTPQMTISDYKQSPLVQHRRPNPIPFSFLEFEAHLTANMFNAIPKYIRGRENLDELNDFLESVIIPCFNEKYKLQHRQRISIRNCADFDLWKLYNDQASYLPGKYFITPGDISRKINRILDKKLSNRIIMLRHVGILQEQRVSQTVCYIWIANSK